MTEFEFMFDSEYGLRIIYIVAETKEQAVEILSKRFPEDIGADGHVNYGDIEEEWIGW